jgi:hypothetical protein
MKRAMSLMQMKSNHAVRLLRVTELALSQHPGIAYTASARITVVSCVMDLLIR